MFRVSHAHFVAVWQLANNPEVVAAALNRPLPKVLAWAHQLRQAGVCLKPMSPRSGYPVRFSDN